MQDQDTIFILDADGNLKELSEAFYDSEALLQKLLADYPKLLAGSQINSSVPRRWLFISRELGIPDDIDKSNRWAVDHLFIDQDAIPTLVEVKRSTDTRIRREVIGQILDYAANATAYWSIDVLENLFNQSCEVLSEDPEVKLAEFLGDQQETSDFWDKVDSNLKAGKIRMLIVADIIPKELVRIIEFLNEQMSPADILGLEIKQYVGENLKTLVPKVVGQTAQSDLIKKTKSSWSSRKKINETQYWDVFNSQSSPEKVNTAKQIIDWIKDRCGNITIGGNGVEKGYGHSMIPSTTKRFGDQSWNILPFSIWTTGYIELTFQYYQNRPPFDSMDYRRKLADMLNQIEGVDIPDEKLTKRPSLDLSLLQEEKALKQFFDAFEWFYDEYEKN